MAKKTNKKKKGAAQNTAQSQNLNRTESPPSPQEQVHTPPSPEPPAPPPPDDSLKRAERIKEEGNVEFRNKNYEKAIELYTNAIQLNPLEPAYLTNRASAYMSIKRFRSALEDCQKAATIQSGAPVPKTLYRLARCHFALGSATPALSSLNAVLAIEPKNTSALQLKDKILEFSAHLRNVHSARSRKEWGMARLAIDKCLQSIEAEGDEIPTEWRLWRVELEIARGNWDLANLSANEAMRIEPNSPDVLALRGLLLFLCGRLPMALQHAQSALRLDPSHEPAQQLRKRIKDVERLKEEGNVAFKANDLLEAVSKYSEAIERVGEKEEEGKGSQIRALLLSNRATTLLKLEKHDEALADTEASLTLVPTSFKALRTRARINLHFEKYDAAIADFRSAMEQAASEGNDTDVRAMRAELKKAEALLKRSKSKDYYKILGVERDCSEFEIKKAYRRESLKHHPDKGGDEEKFKVLVEAHAVLSDPRRRERYDMGEDEDGLNDGGPGGFPGGMHFADIFAQFAGEGARMHAHQGFYFHV